MMSTMVRPELAATVNWADVLLVQAFPYLVLIGTLTLWGWAVVHFVKRRWASSREEPSQLRESFMSANDLAFEESLEEALPGHRIHAKVALASLLDGVQLSRKRFPRELVDFVVQDIETAQIIALIELDDRRAAIERDSARDGLLFQAGYRLVRFDLFNLPSNQTIEMQVLGYLPLDKPPPVVPGGCQVIPFPRKLPQRRSAKGKKA